MSTEPELQELTRLAGELIQRLDRLVGGTGEQLVTLAKTAQHNRRMIWALALSILLDVALTVTMAVGLSYVNDLASKVNDAQLLTQTQVLCPLYQQFINSDTPKTRALAQKNGQDMAARDEAFRVIHHSYDVLGCGK